MFLEARKTIVFKEFKRMRYDASFQLKVVHFAKGVNNSSAAKEFGVNEKQVREWGKLKSRSMKCPRTQGTRGVLPF